MDKDFFMVPRFIFMRYLPIILRFLPIILRFLPIILRFASFLRTSWKYVVMVFLPLYDFLGDIYFTYTVYNKYPKIFNISVGIISLPIIFDYAPVIWDPERRKDPWEHLKALFNQLYIPYLGWKSIRNPEDKELEDRLWKFKVIENSGESWCQAILQTYILWRDGLPVNIFEAIIKLTSIAASCLSVVNTLSEYKLRQIISYKDVTPHFKYSVLFVILELFLIGTRFLFVFGVIVMATELDPVWYYVLIALMYFIPFFLTLILLRPSISADLYMVIDFPIYFSHVCKQLDDKLKLVKSRRNIMTVIFLYSFASMIMAIVGLNTLCIQNDCVEAAAEIEESTTDNIENNSENIEGSTEYVDNHQAGIEKAIRTKIVVYTWLIFSLLSLVQSGVELVCILCSNISFINWAFNIALSERAKHEEEIEEEDQEADTLLLNLTNIRIEGEDQQDQQDQ